ncbi:Vomeronasal type-1 receptor 90 [Sciurus carolinensis]|uniref:Vomeronasal type-1 receptor n=1 Tax=Sciurus carolinensis TaxID=30640 RepID=A0AA41N9X7_SCICA|nr:Vomeronasal type-1 receptor 90 [Sciurus carolinensis]
MNQRVRDIDVKKIFYPQAGIGISANTILLCLQIAVFLVGPKPRLTDLLITHLALTHILMLLTTGILISTDVWEAQDITSDLKCKVLLFLYKVMRGLSICMTCVLSVLQAVTISPSGSWLANFKSKSTNSILVLFLSLWVLTMSTHSNQFFFTVATPNRTQPGLLFINEHCSFLTINCMQRKVLITLMACRDVFFVGLMVLSSGYMVIFLYRHKQRSMSLHSFRFSTNSSPEQRATHFILQFICCFAFLYCVDIIISLVKGITWRNDHNIVCIQMLVANGYATVSPFVIISADTQKIKIIQTIWGKKCQRVRKFI